MRDSVNFSLDHYYSYFCYHCPIMKKTIFLLFYFSLLSSLSFSQKKSVVNTGVFINSLYDLNFPEESFKIDMWLWCTYKDSSLKMNQLIEFPYTKSFNFSNDVTEQKGGVQWLTMRANGEVNKNWNIKNFPFDKQILRATLGFSFDTSVCMINADVANSKIDPDFKLAGWNIDKVIFNRGLKIYNTTFGDPQSKVGSSVYSEFNIDIQISRMGSNLTLIKLILGLIIAFIISVCVFFIKPINTDPRFGLCVGGLFTAVGNKYVTDSLVPSTNDITLIDTLHLVTFVSIFLIVIQSVISLRIYELDTDRFKAISRKFDMISFTTITLLFFISVAILTRNAM